MALESYGVWNKVKQFGNAVGCGYFFDADNGLIGLGEFASVRNNYIPNQPLAIFWTSDGGANWTPSTIPFKGTGRVTSIFMQDRLLGYASIYSNEYSLWKTTDGGKSWQDFTQGNFDLTTCVYATSHAIIKTMWGATVGGSSTDGGRKYSSVFTGGVGDQSNGIDFSDDLNGVVTIGPGDPLFNPSVAYFTHDGGVNWTQGNDLPESWSVYAVKGTKTFFAMSEDGGGNPGQTLYTSQDGGQNWNPRFTFQGSPSFTGHIAGAGNTLYVQTDINTNRGLYRSDDLGSSWVNVGGPSNVRDTRFAVTGCRGEVVYAFDNQGGVWKTTDGGNGAFGLIPHIGAIPGGRAGDTVRIPIYLDSTGAPFTINQFTGNLSLNTDLLYPFGLDTTGTLSHAMAWDTLYKASDGSIAFAIKYKTPLINGIPLSTPILYILAKVYLTVTDTTSVTLNTLNINSGAALKSLVACISTTNQFTLLLGKECGDTSIQQFMITGKPQLLSINPNPTGSSSVNMSIELPWESNITLDVIDGNGVYIDRKEYGNFLKGKQDLIINSVGLVSGEYFLRLHLNNGSYLTGRVVIRR